MICIRINDLPAMQPQQPGSMRHVVGGLEVSDAGLVEKWKNSVIQAVTPHINDIAGMAGHGGGLQVVMFFVFPRPKSHYKPNGELRGSASNSYLKRPGLNCLAGAVMDALLQCGALHDDLVVCMMSLEKRYASHHEQPGCTVVIMKNELG